MKKYLGLVIALIYSVCSIAQEEVKQLHLDSIKAGEVKYYWLELIDDSFSRPVSVPVIVVKGTLLGPTLGLTAAIHGNELNGIKIIQEVMNGIDTQELHGTILAIPGLNNLSINQDRRRYVDDEDLNRNFPGRSNGNRSQQYVWQINQKILSKLDYLIDMHTASFGRINSMYVRADLSNDTIKQMAVLQNADIVLNSKGLPSTGSSSASRTMRAEAMLKGIPTITVEYGNPQIYQTEMTERGVLGIKRTLDWLEMYEFQIPEIEHPVFCEKSYWIYVDQGGLLEVPVNLRQMVKKDEVIGILRDPFGKVLKRYTAPEDGIVIGKSSNPANISGGRIIHLGIITNQE